MIVVSITMSNGSGSDMLRRPKRPTMGGLKIVTDDTVPQNEALLFNGESNLLAQLVNVGTKPTFTIGTGSEFDGPIRF